jgi:hypothetical protein
MTSALSKKTVTSKRRWKVYAAAAVLAALTPSLTMAAPPDSGGSIVASVTVADQVCVLIAQTAIDNGLDFGVLGFDAAATSDAYAITSCSTGGQDLFGSGTNAATSNGQTRWTLVDGSGPRVTDQFSVSAALGAGTPAWLASDAASVVGSIGAAAEVSASHQLLTPPAGSAGAGETLTFELTWVAALSLGG